MAEFLHGVDIYLGVFRDSNMNSSETLVSIVFLCNPPCEKHTYRVHPLGKSEHGLQLCQFLFDNKRMLLPLTISTIKKGDWGERFVLVNG